jgi:RHS repeat-associated protein
MLMPGRSGHSGSGGWVGSSGTSSLPDSLSYDSPRTASSPAEYKATVSIEFLPGFESREVDAFEAFITEGDGGDSSGSGDQGYTSGGYRYGFNGKENDNETSTQDYGMRIYDPRAGRFLSVDPLTKSYPWISPYIFAENDVIRSIDLDGLEKLIVINKNDRYGRTYNTVLKGIRSVDTKEAQDVNLYYANGRDVTGREVLIITRMPGKRDKLTPTDLNSNYIRQIEEAPIDKRQSSVDNSMPIPSGAKEGIAADEDFNHQILRGQKSYDASKFEPFLRTKNFQLQKPIYDEETTPPANMILTGSTGLSNEKASINFESNFMSEQAKGILSNFKNNKGLDVGVIDNITLNILPKDKGHFKLVAADLEKKTGVKVYLKETNLTLWNGSKAGTGYYSLTAKVSGVKN